MEILRFEDVSFTYTQRETPALNNISFSVEEGEILLLCGASGCGKSTLLKLLKPALTPFGTLKGNIIYDGELIHKLDFYRQSSELGFVSQNPANQTVTDKVWHEMAFGLENLGLSQREMELRIGEMASYFGIENWFYNEVKNLSGGQRQLLNLASIMAMQPKVLLLDEPTSMLDPIAASEFLATIEKLNREFGITVIIIEHQLEDAFNICHKALVLDKGNLIAFGKPKEVALKIRNHRMSEALPTALKSYLFSASLISDSSEDEGLTYDDIPLSIQEGRNWLRSMMNPDKSFSNMAEIKENSVEDISKQEEDTDEKPKKAQDNSVLGCKSLTFRYEKKGRDILKDVKLNLNKGEILGILGGNGSGKSTLLSLLCGINKPLTGKIKRNSKIGYLPQNPLLVFSKDRVLDDLTSIVTDSGRTQEEAISLVNSIAQKLQIEGLLDFHPYDLSGGEQQRAAIAKLLLTDADILLLDEPTKAIDSLTKSEIGNMLKDLTSQGKSILTVTHDVDFASSYCDRCLLLFQGRAVGEGTAAEFFRNNHFYTTTVRRMTRGIVEDVISYNNLKNLLVELNDFHIGKLKGDSHE